jgi:ribose-phosphate pyrophosphokinase
MADKLHVGFALILRERYHIREETGTETDQLETKITLVGDVRDKMCFMLDDSIDGSHSFLDSCIHLKRCGASKVYLIGCHGILSGTSLKEIEDCDAVDGVISTNASLL